MPRTTVRSEMKKTARKLKSQALGGEEKKKVKESKKKMASGEPMVEGSFLIASILKCVLFV